MLVVSWLFVLVTHVLAQETNGLTKSTLSFSCLLLTLVCFAVFLFWVQTLLIIMSESHSAFNWYARSRHLIEWCLSLCSLAGSRCSPLRLKPRAEPSASFR
jgi:hypothetical protein